MKLRLADTSVRLYRKKDWSVSVRLHSYLMIHCKGTTGFHLGTYLNRLDCSLTLESGELFELNEYSFTDSCHFEMNHMIYEFWASGRTRLESITDGAGRLHVVYRLFSFDGQGNPDEIDLVVPVLARGPCNQRWRRRVPHAA